MVVHRGTQGLNDWMTDARMFFGDTKNKRFKHAKNIQQRAEEKYGASHVSTIGHSLGSRISEEVGQGSKEILTLNKPTTLADMVKGKKVSDKQIDVRTTKDPVSILRPFQGGNETIEIDSTTNNPLTEHGTETLKRLDPDVMIGRGSLGRMMRGGANNDPFQTPPPVAPGFQTPQQTPQQAPQQAPQNINPVEAPQMGVNLFDDLDAEIMPNIVTPANQPPPQQQPFNLMMPQPNLNQQQFNLVTPDTGEPNPMEILFTDIPTPQQILQQPQNLIGDMIQETDSTEDEEEEEEEEEEDEPTIPTSAPTPRPGQRNPTPGNPRPLKRSRR